MAGISKPIFNRIKVVFQALSIGRLPTPISFFGPGALLHEANKLPGNAAAPAISDKFRINSFLDYNVIKFIIVDLVLIKFFLKILIS